jgi:hypothetical protein
LCPKRQFFVRSIDQENVKLAVFTLVVVVGEQRNFGFLGRDVTGQSVDRILAGGKRGDGGRNGKKEHQNCCVQSHIISSKRCAHFPILSDMSKKAMELFPLITRTSTTVSLVLPLRLH